MRFLGLLAFLVLLMGVITGPVAAVDVRVADAAPVEQDYEALCQTSAYNGWPLTNARLTDTGTSVLLECIYKKPAIVSAMVWRSSLVIGRDVVLPCPVYALNGWPYWKGAYNAMVTKLTCVYKQPVQ